MPGPVPKHKDQRRRRNKPAVDPVSIDTTAQPKAKAPPACKDWHDVAKKWYKSLSKSGQSVYYEPSDWMYAYYVAEIMSITLLQGMKINGMLVSQVLQAATQLLATPGERRRLGVELEGPVVDPDALDAEDEINELLAEFGQK